MSDPEVNPSVDHSVRRERREWSVESGRPSALMGLSRLSDHILELVCQGQGRIVADDDGGDGRYVGGIGGQRETGTVDREGPDESRIVSLKTS